MLAPTLVVRLNGFTLALPPEGAAQPTDYLGRPGVTSFGWAVLLAPTLVVRLNGFTLALPPAEGAAQPTDYLGRPGVTQSTRRARVA